jgi:hypothetical protein
MAKTKTTIDTTAGTKAYALAVQYHAELEPRLPVGTVANLAADLTTLGASPTPPPVPTTPAQPPTSLAKAMTTAVTLISAVHEAIRGAQAEASVRKAYGVSSKSPGQEAKAVLASGEKIVAQAHANPTEALSLGILPSDVTALVQALAELTAAEALAKEEAGNGGATGKERHAAETRMHEAVARIGGAGVLAFATQAAVRAEFSALKGMKSG